LNGAQINKHLKLFIDQNELEEFGCKEVSVACKINYNNALRVLEAGIKNGNFDPMATRYRARIAR